jgi:hypothetical protein
MNVTIARAISVLKVVAIFTVLVSGAYGVVIPAFFPAYKTYSILIVGVALAALIGGYIGYQSSDNDALLIKVGFGLCYAIVVAILVFLLSLFILLNVRGS